MAAAGKKKKQPGMIEQQRYTCAIGALQSVTAINRAMPILHSGPGCGEMVAGFFDRKSGYVAASTSPCTNFSEREVVFGGIDRLRTIIRNSYKVLDTDLQVLMTGCTGGIVGDDIESLAQEFADEGRPIVAVDTPGFKTNNYQSHSIVANAIIDQYVSLYEADNAARSEPETINLFASIPYQDPFWKGNLREYKRLLEGLGLKVHVLYGPESPGVQEWQQIPRANFNILASPWYGKPIADHLKDKYGQPYVWFESVPIGANATEKFLRQVLAFALEQGARLDEKKADAFIRHESDVYYEEIDTLATFLLEFRYGLPNHAHIIHDAGYVTGLARFLLHETGIVPKELFIVDNTPEKYQEGIGRTIRSVSDRRCIPVTFEPDAGRVQEIIRSLRHEGRGLIIGSGWDRQLAREKHYDFISAAVPSSYRLQLTTNYIGFTGGLRVIEDIYDTVLETYA